MYLKKNWSLYNIINKWNGKGISTISVKMPDKFKYIDIKQLHQLLLESLKITVTIELRHNPTLHS